MYCIKLGIKYSELTFGANTSRDNVGGNLCYEVNDQNLPDLNLARIDVNTVRVGEIIYQPLRENEQVLNPNRNGLDLINQRGQEWFVFQPTVLQPGTRPRFESNSIDFSQLKD